jgi:uncharacterized protein (TIGR02145 family)
MKTIFTILLILVAGFCEAQSGSITSLTPAQRTDGSMIVDISYDLSGSDPDYDITVEVSFDGGSSYTPADSVSGDTGLDIVPGTGKSIAWEYGKEYPGQYSAQTRIKLTALYTFECGDIIIDPRDSQTYTTVEIGTQCWMAENMNVGIMIPNVNAQADNGVLEKYCYGNSTGNCDVYGGLYQWNEMMQYVTTPGAKGICPDNWHLPTDAEVCTLEQYVDPTITCGTTGYRGVDGGGKLKEAGTAHWASPNTGATNSSGFTALPGGFRDPSNSSFTGLMYWGFFWTSSTIGAYVPGRDLAYDHAQVGSFPYDKAYSLSVRCLRD